MNKVTVILPRDKKEGKKTRDIVTSILKSCWKAINEWTLAFNSGLQSLKAIVTILVSMKPEKELPIEVHSNCNSLTVSLISMVMYKKFPFSLKPNLIGELHFSCELLPFILA